MLKRRILLALVCATGLTLAVFCQGQEHSTSTASSANPSSAASLFSSSEQPGGGGTPGYIPIWVTPYILSNSIIFQSGGKVGIGTTSPATKLDVAGGATIRGNLFVAGATTQMNTAILTAVQNGSANVQPSPTAPPPPSAVVGKATATSGFVAGVVGISSSPYGLGVVGYSTATTGGTPAVVGLSNANEGFGIQGVALSPSGQTEGVRGEVYSPDGTAGRFVNRNGGEVLSAIVGQEGSHVELFSVDSNHGTNIQGTFNVNSQPGNSIFFVNSNGVSLPGPLNVSSAGANIQGPLGVNAGSNSLGVNSSGGTYVTGPFNVGQPGTPFLQVNSGGSYIQGPLNISQQGAPLFQLSSSGSFIQGPFYIWGGVLQGAVTVTNGLTVNGSFNVTGSKNAIQNLPDGRRVTLTAMESPESWFEDFGTARLQRGVATVALDPTFAATVNTALDYHVFLTPQANCRGLYVAQKTPTGFEVRELGRGKSGVAFDYRIVARRRGFEKERLKEVEPRRASR